MNTHYLRSLNYQNQEAKKKEYPFNLPVVKNLHTLDFHPNITFLIGENGTGKSTLIEAIAIAYGLNAEGGSKNFNFATEKTHSKLHDYLKLTHGIVRPKDKYFLRAESFYNVASHIDELDQGGGGPPIKDSYGGVSLHHQSHGESFFSLFMHRLHGKGLYIFDEPEAALSPQRQYAFLLRMHELIQKQSQFIIATHSPILLAYPDAKILQISEHGFEEVAYKETDHYQLYKTFLNNPEYMLNKLGIKN
jgi:predicted ATPase